MRSIKAKLLLQSMAGVLVVALLGMLSATWVTVTDHRTRARQTMDTALDQVAEDLDRLAKEVEATAADEARTAVVVQAATHLMELHAQGLQGVGDDMRATLCIKAIQHLRSIGRSRGLTLVGFYEAGALTAYAHENRIRLVTSDSPPRHLAPASPSALVRFREDLWQPAPVDASIPVPAANLPLNGARFISTSESPLALEAAAPIFTTAPSSESYEDTPVEAGAVLLRADIRLFLNQITQARSDVMVDVFTVDGQAITSRNDPPRPLLSDVMRGSATVAGVLIDTDRDDVPYFAFLRPYRYDTGIVAWLAAFMPKDTVTTETRKIILLQSIGLLVGLIVAAVVALITGGILNRPIVAVANQMRDIAATQDLGRRITVSGKDEVAILAHSFNDMTAALATTTSALRDAEAKYRGIFENASEGLFQSTLGGRLVTANPALAHMFGYQSTEEMCETSTNVTTSAYARREDRTRFLAILRHAGKVVDYEMDLKRKDGSIFRVLVRAHICPPNALGQRLIEGSVRDISAREEKEKAVQARHAAEAATRAKSAFLAHMSHEIRTPLNAINGMSRLLARPGLSPDQQREHASKILKASQLLEGILNDVLDVSKIEAGRMTLETVPFNLDDVIQEAVDLIALQATEKGLRVRTDVASDVPRSLQGDSLRLGQVLANLAANAVKFTYKGDIDIRVALTETRGESIRLTVEVQDTGIGIDPARQAMLFQPFTQGDSSTMRRFGGTGLGLAICHHIVCLMGGTIGVTSQPGEGSTFRFSVWLQRAHPSVDPRDVDRRIIRPRRPTLAEAEAHLRGSHALLVEDNSFNQDVATALLTDVGMTVDIAADGQEGVALARTGDYDVVLMDLQMPVMDGYTATAQLRANPRCSNLPIIAMTAHASPDDRQRCLEVGISDHVTKPVAPEHLYAVLMTWVRANRSTDAAASRDNEATPPLPAPISQEASAARLYAPSRDADVDDTPLPTDPAITSVFDLNRALRHLNQKASRLTPLMDAFRARFATTADDIAAALSSGDHATAFRAAHSLKGIAGTLGAKALETSASALTETLRPATLDEASSAPPETTAVAAQLRTLRTDLDRAVGAAMAFVSATRPADAPSAINAGEDASPDGQDGRPLREALAEVTVLLDRQGFGARRTFQSLRTPLGRLVPADTLATMDDALGRLDFVAARATWSEICATVESAPHTVEVSQCPHPGP